MSINVYQPIRLVALGSLMSFTAHAAEPSSKDINFYGSIRVGVDVTDAGTSDDGANGRDYLSRVGLKASMKIDEGMTVVGQIEYGIREENLVDLTHDKGPTLRVAAIGLKGELGEVYYGTQNLLWHTYVRTAYFSDGLDTVRQGGIRDDDLLQYFYKQKNWSVAAGAQFKGQDGDSIDQWQLGGEYKMGPVKMQAAWSKDNSGDNKGNLYGVSAWWAVTDVITLSAFMHKATNDYDLYGSSTGTVRLKESSVEGNKNGLDSCKTEDRTDTGFYASYTFGENQIHGRYAVDSCDITGDVESVKVEYVRHFTKELQAWLAYEDLSNDTLRKPKTSSGEDMSQLQAGVRYDF